MSPVLVGDYAIGNPERRARVRNLAGDFEVMPNDPGRVLVKINDEFSLAVVQVPASE